MSNLIKADLPVGYRIEADRQGKKIYGYRIIAPDGKIVCFGVGKKFAEAQAAYHAAKPQAKKDLETGFGSETILVNN